MMYINSTRSDALDETKSRFGSEGYEVAERELIRQINAFNKLTDEADPIYEAEEDDNDDIDIDQLLNHIFKRRE